MADHYYSGDPDVARDEREIQAILRGKAFRFRADAGVFSKKGIDFGTRLLIETAELPETGEILDLGCGYGPVGIACAFFAPACRVTMVDVNRRALELAERNAGINGVKDRVEVLESDGLQAVRQRRFAGILTNPPIRTGKKTVYRLFRECRDQLEPGGSLWVVIRKQQGGASAKKELETLFPEVGIVEKKKGFWILRSRKESGD
ncbi:16S rRNA (guanine1207-N2)-methyltransferase [Melghirimyces profundicolus]|uniref:16S rRNA (Guanine1207-N2)-methyltransferase n=1 Tax=Melghirimyces profundicolus TaxID=1242148 RepID=A0A2T6BQ56_9BACL|nr:class I SAM-dependent methyltransferase [Melghirimyces profundicolus]PTX58166.1 16S rRNA (guanine1207-N2)-methyltransferase [Melghirimyces profundicolus]